MPPPSHSRKKPEAAEAFKSELAEKLGALEIQAGSRVKHRIIRSQLQKTFCISDCAGAGVGVGISCASAMLAVRRNGRDRFIAWDRVMVRGC